MNCEKCGSENTGVTDRRPLNGTVRRRRRCNDCEHKFTTYEVGKLVHGKKDNWRLLRMVETLMRMPKEDREAVMRVVDSMGQNPTIPTLGKVA